MRRALVLTLTAAMAAGPARGAEPAPPGPAAGAAEGTVTFLSGEATRTAAGRTEELSAGGPVHAGDVLETGRRTRLEVKLADDSFLRLGPSSRVELRAAAFGKAPEDRQVQAQLAAGSLWAQVSRALGGSSRFEVGTETAVAGVRGTVFRVEIAGDGSCAVKVYEGTVAVSEPEGAAPPGGRWQRTAGAMSEVRVPARGVPGPPARFALAGPGRDEFESWNRARDDEARRDRAVPRDGSREPHHPRRERPGR